MISTPFHPTPHSPSRGSERGLVSSPEIGEERGERISHDSAQLGKSAGLAVLTMSVNQGYA